MVNTLSAQEELQQSVILSEEDAEYEEDDAPEAMDIDTSVQQPGSSVTQRESNRDSNAPTDPDEGDRDEEDANQGQELDPHLPIEELRGGDEDQEAEREPGQDDDASRDEDGSESQIGSVHDGDGGSDLDAEGEDDDILRQSQNGVLSSDGDDEDEEDEAEGVGAVKIKPGETDEEESESGDDASFASGGSDRDTVDEWEAAAENEDEEEEDSEGEPTTLCMFCKKDEEHDPGEEFESFLACQGCGEHAHQQCARDADAINGKLSASSWKCLECSGNNSESGSEADSLPEDEDVEANGEIQDGEVSPATSRRSTASRIARDLLPSQRGVNKPDSHSVFNQLVLDEDPMDGSRVLRKRKTSSAEADAEEVMSLRKRRKNTPDESVKDDAAEDMPNGADEASRPRSARSLRLKISSPAAKCTVLKQSRGTLLLRMRVAPAELRQILSREPQPRKRPNRSGTSRSVRSAARTTSAIVEPPMPSLMPSSYTQPFYSFYDKETDELKGKPYGGILTESEADTSKTLPTKDDRRRFDEAKQKADEEWRTRILAMQAETEAVPLKKSRKVSSGPASQIECIEFGGWEIDTWYAAPYPEEYSRNRVLYICEFCLKYMNSDYVAWRHKLKCPAKHPPGDEIYRQGSISFFEVDGRKNPVFCQNLCLLAKLFLGSKTLYYDVEPFLFYVLCEYDDLGYHFVGYFSKEKRASSQNNVSCILTLPIHQRKGYGNLLIDFSYLLTRAEEKTGSPEKPLSDMGLVSYRNYWRLVMCKYLLEHTPDERSTGKGLSIRQISDDTGMMPDDVISALEGLRCLVRDPQTKLYAFRVDLAFCRDHVAKWESKNYVKLNDKALTWTPYVMGRSNATNFELGPALNAIAPREDEEENKAAQILAKSGISADDFAAAAEHSIAKPLVPVDSMVLESTEPNDIAVIVSTEEIKPNGVEKENQPIHTESQSHHSAEVSASAENDDDWQAAYNDIPPVRFEVFPPVNVKRPGPSRLNSTIVRPILVRAPASAPRPRARRSIGGSSSRKSASRPKTSGSRRKTGGTGRGPGRWPKGTKKSDYGNADSGPGLPPSWLQRKNAAGSTAETAEEAEAEAEAEARGTVEVKQHKGKEAEAVAARLEGQQNDESGDSDAEDSGGEDDPDIVMNENDDDEDEDAEGEDE